MADKKAKQPESLPGETDLDSEGAAIFLDRVGGEEAGRPRTVGEGERKRAGDRVERAARDLGLDIGGEFTAPEGTREQVRTWEEAALAELRRRGPQTAFGAALDGALRAKAVKP